MGLTKTEKQGWESYFIHGDFSEVMETGETIDVPSSTITVEDAGLPDADPVVAPIDATATLTDQTSIYAEGFKLYVRIRAGVGDEGKSPYKITFRITTSNGNKWEVDGQIKVKEK